MTTGAGEVYVSYGLPRYREKKIVSSKPYLGKKPCRKLKELRSTHNIELGLANAKKKRRKVSRKETRNSGIQRTTLRNPPKNSILPERKKRAREVNVERMTSLKRGERGTYQIRRIEGDQEEERVYSR